MMRFRRQIFFIAFWGVAQVAIASDEYPKLRQGIKAYHAEKYEKAERLLREASIRNPKSKYALYDLGNTLYQMEMYEDAANSYRKATSMMSDSFDVAASYHNIGNCMMNMQKFGDAVKAYKQALRLCPNDDETRYNLALANELLRKKQQEERQNRENQKNSMSSNDRDNQKESPRNQQNDTSKMQNIERTDEGISKENAEQILDAFANEERLRRGQIEQRETPQKIRTRPEKDW